MKQLTAFIILFLNFCSISMGQNTCCCINLKNGKHLTYVVRERLNIIPTSNTLTLLSPTLQTSFTLSSVLSYHFTNEQQTDAINPITTPDINILFTSPDEITIQGIHSCQPIRIFSTNGTQYPANPSHYQDCTTISLHALPTGIYIITFPGTSITPIKVIRK